MLVIREKQQEALCAYALDRFERHLVSYIRTFAPGHATFLGNSQLRICIRAAYLRARGHGFTLRGPVRLWLDLTFMFGTGFDTDPQLETISNVLDQTPADTWGDQLERANKLRARAVEFAGQVVGDAGDRERAAVARFRALSPMHMACRSDDEIIDLLIKLHPEKTAVTGRPALRTVIAHARVEANRLGLNAQPGPTALALLMFAFGHECLTDPLFPWIARSLREDDHDVSARLERARRMALRYISDE